MIITKLLGGLGNQMFQFAAGYALAKHHNLPLKIDITALKKYPRHAGFQLDDIFSGSFELANKVDLTRSLGLFYGKRTLQGITISNEETLKALPRVVQHPTHNFWPDFFEYRKKNIYVSGYWQSSKYFKGYENDLRAIFEFKNDLKNENKELAEEMQSEQSVSIHLRRGDYVSNPRANAFHGVCSPTYYKAAIGLVKQQNPYAKYFVFSDDAEFASAEFQDQSDIKIVSNNRERNSYIDMHLMSFCKHHIIANSTFSWWGAWLSQHDLKTVIAPKKWFAGSEDEIVDIYEDAWIKL